MTMKASINDKLMAALKPTHLVVTDESHLHAGHAGWREGGETHFRLKIVSDAFVGKTRLERHRMVNTILAGELEGGVHALAMATKAPGEA